jgi:hypothetical protein
MRTNPVSRLRPCAAAAAGAVVVYRAMPFDRGFDRGGIAARSLCYRRVVTGIAELCAELCGPVAFGGGRHDHGPGGDPGEGRLDRDQLAVAAWHLVDVDDDRRWTGTDAVAQSWDDVMVKEHHGATTSQRSGGSPAGSRFHHVSPRYVMHQLSTHDPSTHELLNTHLSGYHPM